MVTVRKAVADTFPQGRQWDWVEFELARSIWRNPGGCRWRMVRNDSAELFPRVSVSRSSFREGRAEGGHTDDAIIGVRCRGLMGGQGN